jgi:flavin-dependent dehydrogenase
MGPLRNGSTAVIIGGGPGGAGSALALKKLATELGREISIVLYEGKIFEGSTHYNQCAGVLSPPIVDIFEKDLCIQFPWHLVQKEISGYVLHSEHDEILLEDDNDRTYAVRRVAFDDYVLKQVKERGITVVHSRVTDLEFSKDGVLVYSESDNRRADVIIGAFGMDDGTARIFERVTAYRQPRFVSSIVIKIHPGEKFISQFGNNIHVFLPPLKEIEFGAVTPKMNHLTINIAGLSVNAELMDTFLHYPPVRAILPPNFNRLGKDNFYFKGRFPLRLSRGYYGDRYVILGDAAGLLRPFKGKGINMGMVTAVKAVRTIMKEGISREAFERDFRSECRDVVDDLPYGKTVRWLTIKSSNLKLLDYLVETARCDQSFKTALFNLVSAHKPFKEIFREMNIMRVVMKVLISVCLSFFKIKKK